MRFLLVAPTFPKTLPQRVLSAESPELARLLSRQGSQLSDCPEQDEVAKRAGGELVKEEESETGRVSWRAYVLALKARGVLLTVLLLLLVIGSEAGYLAAAAWLSVWTSQNASNVTSGNNGGHSSQYYISIYAALTIALAVVHLFQQLTSLVSSMLEATLKVTENELSQ